MDNLEKLKFNLREEQTPYFTNEELLYLLEKNNGNVNKASYEGLILKAETTGLNVSGLTTKIVPVILKCWHLGILKQIVGC